MKLLIPAFLMAAVWITATPALAEPDEHVEVVAQFDVDGQTYYVVEDHGEVQLWKESNGLTTSGLTNRLTGEPTGLQVGDGCLLGDGTFVYFDDHGHDGEGHQEEEPICLEGTFYEGDTRVTNGYLLGLLS